MFYGTQAGKESVMGCTVVPVCTVSFTRLHGAPPIPQLPNKSRSLRATHSTVLTPLAMTPVQELYPGTRQPR